MITAQLERTTVPSHQPAATGAAQPGAKPALTRQSVRQRYQRHVNRSFGKLAGVMNLPVEVRSAGCLVYDETGDAYLDCGGYGVFLMGHCHPRVIAAVKAQLERHPLSTRGLLNLEQVEAAETLISVTPRGMQYVFFANSGAEATELGLKLARLHGKTKLIAMQGGYHGKTFGALSITARAHFQDPFRPLLPDVSFVAYSDPNAVEALLAEQGNQSAVILEPVQGEGGAVAPPLGYLRQVADLCKRYGALLILDEIQSGLGRLGHWWGANREGVTPDIMLVGKGLSGGVVPVSAVVATAAAYEPLNNDFILHSSTFAGSPLAMAAAKSAVEVIRDENLVERAGVLGDHLLSNLRTILSEVCPELVVDVRGVGLLIGIEFMSSDLAGELMMKLMERRIIVSYSLNSHRVLRLTPPALLTAEQCAWLFTAVYEAGREMHKEAASA
jgi:putrescine aminotransferase